MTGLMLISASLVAQKPSDDRMKRDIAVLETALSEMMKQAFDPRSLFFMNVKGNYVSGYGVTFTVHTGMMSSVWSTGGNGMVMIDGNYSGFEFRTPAPPEAESEITEREAREAKAAMKSDKNAKHAQKERDKAERDAQAARNQAEHAVQAAREAEHAAREATVYGLQSPNGVNAYAYTRNRKRIDDRQAHAHDRDASKRGQHAVGGKVHALFLAMPKSAAMAWWN